MITTLTPPRIGVSLLPLLFQSPHFFSLHDLTRPFLVVANPINQGDEPTALDNATLEQANTDEWSFKKKMKNQ